MVVKDSKKENAELMEEQQQRKKKIIRIQEATNEYINDNNEQLRNKDVNYVDIDDDNHIYPMFENI